MRRLSQLAMTPSHPSLPSVSPPPVPPPCPLPRPGVQHHPGDALQGGGEERGARPTAGVLCPLGHRVPARRRRCHSAEEPARPGEVEGGGEGWRWRGMLGMMERRVGAEEINRWGDECSGKG